MRTLQFGLKFIQLYKRGIKDGGSNMNTEDYINFLEKEIHTTIIATVDEKGLPVTCAIDICIVMKKAYIFLLQKEKAFIID